MLVDIKEIFPGMDDEGLARAVEESKERSKHGKAWGGTFTDTLGTLLSENGSDARNIRLALQHFRDQVVVDLGPGPLKSGYDLADTSNAKAYVGVEPYFEKDLAQKIGEADRINGTAVPIELDSTVVPVHMLAFLKLLKPDSVSVLAGGIDHKIIEPVYGEKVAQEIERVLDPNGAFISYKSDIRPNLGERQNGPVSVYRK